MWSDKCHWIVAIIERGFDPRHHAWSDDHLNLRLHHLRKGEDGYLCAFLYRKAEVVVAIDRKIECSVVSFLFREVCAVLLTVDDDEEHVSLLCVRYPSPLWVITVGGFAPPNPLVRISQSMMRNTYGHVRLTSTCTDHWNQRQQFGTHAW